MKVLCIFVQLSAGCGSLNKTSVIAKLHHCKYATNAGFFDTSAGGCVGNVIANGNVLQVYKS